MGDPAVPLQKAVHDTLRAAGPVAALVGANVFDRVPAGSDPMPRVVIGDDEVADDGDSCGDGWRVTLTVSAWSREVGRPAVKTIAAAVRDALATEIAVTGYRVVSGLHVATIYRLDPAAHAAQAVMTFEYLIDPAG